eukprot:14801530-Alexandrium_andersonii.AAC.1
MFPVWYKHQRPAASLRSLNVRFAVCQRGAGRQARKHHPFLRGGAIWAVGGDGSASRHFRGLAL